MKRLNRAALCIWLSLILAFVPASLLATADNCCPDAGIDCHSMNLAVPCAQCVPLAIAPSLFLSTPARQAVVPVSLQDQYQYPPGHAIWRPPTLLA